LQAQFANPALCGITQAYVFTLPFVDDPSNSHTVGLDGRAANIRGSPPLAVAVKEMLRRFTTKKEAVLHGDLHAGSVMSPINDDTQPSGGKGTSKVIDHEFVFVGR
jgi:5-methylthioribose kinase